MREEHIIKQLSTLKSIQPDADFARSARTTILYRSEPMPVRFFGLTQSLSATLSIGLVVMFFVFVALGGVATVFRTPLSPTFQGVDEQSLASEAGSINQTIDFHLNEVAYISGEKENTLAMSATPNEGDANSDQEIDLLLTQAKSY
ncbi:MAG: hypothetical protein NUV96_02535 [Candidatus Colwellbacteria bacterium]|nr:hypothetical protein [Candidatus Colwellbacteria bacterium]